MPCITHWIPAPLRAMNPLRTAAALGFTFLVALAGCGGGSGGTTQPPAPTLAAPTNFTAPDFRSFEWSGSPGATHYELYVDPDGAGPLPEAKADAFNSTTNSGFEVQTYSDGRIGGVLHVKDTLGTLATKLNSTYRLRACNTSECSAFTAAQAHDLVNAIRHEFASGLVPLVSSTSTGQLRPQLSKDGLTLAITSWGLEDTEGGVVSVLTRDSTTQPWRQQQVLRQSGTQFFGGWTALSADGNTLAVRTEGPLVNEATGSMQGTVYLYKRSASTWSQQAFFAPPSAPSACPSPCQADIQDVRLSADGNLLAASIQFNSTAAAFFGHSVATYARSGDTWASAAYLETDNHSMHLSLALSSDGNTLALNEGGWVSFGTPLTTTTPFIRVYARQSNDHWSLQARIPAGVVKTSYLEYVEYSAVALSSDGNTLAIHALNAPGHPTPELDLKPADLSCGDTAADGWYMALYARHGGTWQRQTAISRGLQGSWALARDGNALFYGNTLFSRSNGAWACP